MRLPPLTASNRTDPTTTRLFKPLVVWASGVAVLLLVDQLSTLIIH